MQRRRAGGPEAPRSEPWERLDGLAGWDDVVLPAAVREQLTAIPAQFGARFWSSSPAGFEPTGSDAKRGLLVLLGGPRGTGKTLAARALAGASHQPVLQADVESMFARGRGEAAQLVVRLFATAQRLGAVLVFDRADNLLRAAGAGSAAGIAAIDARDLLRRSEAHAGVVVFPTSIAGELSPIVLQRFDRVVELPFPDQRARAEIWRRSLSVGSGLSADAGDFLARSFELSGKQIAMCSAQAQQQARRAGRAPRLEDVVDVLERSPGLAAAAAPGALAELRRLAGAPAAPAGAPMPAAPAPAPAPPAPAAPPAAPTAAAPTPSVPAAPAAAPTPSVPAAPAAAPTPSVPAPLPPAAPLDPPAQPPAPVPSVAGRPPEPFPSVAARTRAPEPSLAARAPAAAPAPEPAAPVPAEPIATPAPGRGPRAPRPRRPGPRLLGGPLGTRRGLATVALLGALGAVVMGLSAAERRSLARTTTVTTPATVSLERTAAVGPVRFSYPTSWRPQAAKSLTPGAGLTFTAALTVASTRAPRGQLILGTTGSRSAGSPLPTRFISVEMTGNPTPQLVTLGGHRFYRVLDPRLQLAAGSQSVYALASGVGAVVALCRTSSQAFVALCERALATLSAPPATALAVKPPAAKLAYARALNAIIGRLDGARTTGARQLAGAQVASAQADAARALALAHTEAATAMAGLSPGPAAAANTGLVAALRRVALAYTQLGDAAGVVAPVTFNADRKVVAAANSALAAALGRLRALGYQVG